MIGIKRDIVAQMALSLVCIASSATLCEGAQVLTVAQAQAQTQPPAASAPVPAAEPAAKDVPRPFTEPATAKKSPLSIPLCSVRYLEAKVEGKLNGRKWVDFRRDECGAKDTTAIFPTEISPKYSTEKDLDKARTLTCADQFKANKATNANGGLKWIEKDGGYYGECIIRLKG
jgi:hypothetical protein